MKFPDVKELIMQINKDKLKAEEYIKKINNIWNKSIIFVIL